VTPTIEFQVYCAVKTGRAATHILVGAAGTIHRRRSDGAPRPVSMGGTGYGELADLRVAEPKPGSSRPGGPIRTSSYDAPFSSRASEPASEADADARHASEPSAGLTRSRVTTPATQAASARRRAAHTTRLYACPHCPITFTKRSNLEGARGRLRRAARRSRAQGTSARTRAFGRSRASGVADPSRATPTAGATSASTAGRRRLRPSPTLEA
jgi:hypothetical protein